MDDSTKETQPTEASAKSTTSTARTSQSRAVKPSAEIREERALREGDENVDQPRNTLTETGMEATSEERAKAGEQFEQATADLKPAGDPSDFAQERVRTTPEHRSEHAADEDVYPEDKEGDADRPGVEPGTEGFYKEINVEASDAKADDTGKG